MIRGVTHDDDGRLVQRLSVATKVAIGLPPQGDRNYPTKLDHFIFLKKVKAEKGVDWVPDEDLTKHFGEKPREISIILIDDDIENVFPTSYAWWTQTERKCWGDGHEATRRTQDNPSGQRWTPCGIGCPELDNDLCKPSGDLRFVLAEFPRLGSVCRIHTSSYKSIRQIHSALQEIQQFTGGRLAGIECKLVVRPEETTYFDKKASSKKTTTIWALSLEIGGQDMKRLISNMTQTAVLFAESRKMLGAGRVIEVAPEDEREQAREISAEFTGESPAPPAAKATDTKSEKPKDKSAEKQPEKTAEKREEKKPEEKPKKEQKPPAEIKTAEGEIAFLKRGTKKGGTPLHIVIGTKDLYVWDTALFEALESAHKRGAKVQVKYQDKPNKERTATFSIVEAVDYAAGAPEPEGPEEPEEPSDGLTEEERKVVAKAAKLLERDPDDPGIVAAFKEYLKGGKTPEQFLKDIGGQ